MGCRIRAVHQQFCMPRLLAPGGGLHRNLTTGWATVAHVLDITEDEFESYVDRAVESVPEELLALVDNCILVVEEESPPDMPELLGIYEGVPLDQRGVDYSGVLPDRIVIFRNPLLRHCRTRAELIEQVRVTVVHEIAHFFGIDDDRLDELGYG